jgi:hypothetical protein
MITLVEIAEITKGYKRAVLTEAGSEILNAKQWPQTVKCRFLEAGLVDYTDLNLGMVLVQRPFLDKVRQTFVGKPVIDEQHKNAKPENFKEVADGVVIRAWNNPEDGWDWCEFLVWDEQTLRHCKDPQYFVSCAYDPTKVDRNGGKYHNIPYDGEFLEGAYTHLAIVKDPRYEGANIVWNSVGGDKHMNLFKIFRKSEEVAEVDGAKSFIEVDGEQVSVENAVKLIKAENAKAKNGAMADDDIVKIDGKDYSGKDIKNAIRNAKKKAKNSDGEEGEKAGDQEDSEKDEKKEGEKRDKGEAKNDIEEKAVEEDEAKRDKAEAKNAVEKEEKGKHIKTFREVMEMRNNQPGVPTITTQQERVALGNQMYGKTTQEVA